MKAREAQLASLVSSEKEERDRESKNLAPRLALTSLLVRVGREGYPRIRRKKERHASLDLAVTDM